MSFDLSVEIAGVCLYLIHPDLDEVAILMPDGRRGKVDRVHLDKDSGEPHAGYLRFDLASLGPAANPLLPSIPGGEEFDGPAYEGVHRFDRQVLHFGMEPAPGTKPGDLHLANFDEFASTLEPLPDLFSTNPATLLMRTTLKGGTLTTEPGNQLLGIPKRLHKDDVDGLHTGAFAGSARWAAEVPGNEITLTIAGFDGTAAHTLVLHPVTQPDGKRRLRLKIANLCCNALEWKWLSEDDGRGPDLDFKWLYRLFDLGQAGPMLQGTELPVPEEVPPLVFGGRHCNGARKRFPFPREPLPGA